MAHRDGSSDPSDGTYYNLGDYHRPVSTSSPQAQIWFDRGLIWTYGFNHEEAAHCFQQAITHDAHCAMAYWGLAYTLGPNYNKPWQFFDQRELETTVQRTHQAVQNARENTTTATPVEAALVQALQHRYPQDQPPSDSSLWNESYAEAMSSVYSNFPDDLDVAVLYADALMNLTPWELWDIKTGQTAPNARTLEIKAVLDRALTQDGGLRHPGLLHLYIHLMEMSGAPETALLAADHLRGLVPDAGHLNHMPTHLDILCGDYRAAMASNSAAIRADERFVARAGPVNFYTLYRSHDYHFRIYAAMFAGRSRVALDTAAALEASIPEELLRVESPPMADWLEGFLAMRVHVLIRFGRWEAILALEPPRDVVLYAVTTAMTHYAKGVALAATGRVEEADISRGRFREAVDRVPASRMLFNNRCVDILAVAAAMLDGELEYRRGRVEAAFECLRRAIALDDGLPYDEPWGWMQPTRHAYGALLLEQGRVGEAAAVYAADLGLDETLPRPLQHPNNGGSVASDSFPQKCRSFLGGHLADAQHPTVAFVAAGTNLTFYGANSTCDHTSLVTPTDLCRLSLSIPTSTRSGADVELWLPSNWTGRFLQTGNGGIDGCIRYDDLAYGVSNGFAAAGSNNGHDGKTVSALYQNEEVTIDFAWRALRASVVVSKNLIESFYGKPHSKAYYIGCSLGGRQGIDSADRFPDDFDGILAGAPAVDFNNLTSWRASFFPITGPPTSTRFLTSAHWALVHDEVLHQCDGIDGVQDDIITDPTLCHFQADRLLCAGTPTDTCLSAAQVETVRRVFSPLLNEDGHLIYPAMQPGSELKATQGLYSGTPWLYSEEWFKYVVYDPTWDAASFTIHDAYVADALNPGHIRTWPSDLARFRNRGGRLILYHGQQDEKITSFNSHRLYDHLARSMRLSTPEMDGFLRFFRVPGMGHCSGGPGAWCFGQLGAGPAHGVPFSKERNLLAALVAWVEDGIGPDTVLGTKFVEDRVDRGVDKEREHCRYPLRSMYMGGNASSAGSWRCT
ncbi:tannase and feruloyl esterase-domain-containing protein [Aspergillus ambiguus]|uniref:TPR domain protein n=1 Tax=Aspergillus ambiguus TaxID=176160 RepID=UPI003CCDF09E